MGLFTFISIIVHLQKGLYLWQELEHSAVSLLTRKYFPDT
nr:MAG TPA: hypothetical protein [Caudoviricetes sp.]